MKLFLTGPTGQLGSAIVDALTDAGHDILGLARDEAAAAALRTREIEAVVGDLADVEFVAAQAAKSVDRLAVGGSHTAPIDTR